MNALKCDRCGKYYDYDPTVRYNYISFGHKDIVPSKHQQTKDPDKLREYFEKEGMK